MLSFNEPPAMKAAIAIDEVLSVLGVSSSAEKDMVDFCEALEESGDPVLLNVVADMRAAADISERTSKFWTT